MARAKTTIGSGVLKMLSRRIHGGQCVPFLGAAANVSSKEYEGLKLGKDVEKDLAEELGYKRPGCRDLARLALELADDTDKTNLAEVLRESLQFEDREPSPLLKTLAGFDTIKLIITTNYDRLLEKALGDRNYKVVIQPTRGFTDKELKQINEELMRHKDLIVYKIHGSFIDPASVNGANQGRGQANMDDKILGSKKTSLIITEDDYIEFLADVGRQNLRIPTYIISKIQTSSLLFLGYSLEDWDFRTIYNVLSKYMPGSGWEKKLDQNGNKQNDEEKRKSIAIQWKPKSFWVKFWQKKGIDIYNMDIYDFASQLKDTYDEMYTRRGEQ